MEDLLFKQNQAEHVGACALSEYLSDRSNKYQKFEANLDSMIPCLKTKKETKKQVSPKHVCVPLQQPNQMKSIIQKKHRLQTKNH